MPQLQDVNLSQEIANLNTSLADKEKCFFVTPIPPGEIPFLTFPVCFQIPIIFSNLNYNCYNILGMRNLQEQVKKAFCYQKLF